MLIYRHPSVFAILIRRLLFLFVAVTLLGYSTMVGFLYVQQRTFIYHPDAHAPDINALAPKYDALKARILNIGVSTQDGVDLKAWFIPPALEGGRVLLFFHGNTGDRSDRLHKFLASTEAGYGVLLAEHRGYGGNPSTPTEEGFYHDARAYYAWLVERGYDAERLIIYGESLGTGVAVQLALEHQDVAGLILETPYARLSDPAQKRYFFIPFIESLMHDKYVSIDKIGDIHAPKLVMIAGRDEVLSPETGLALYKVAAEPKALQIFEEAAHNNLHHYGADRVVLEFLAGLE